MEKKLLRILVSGRVQGVFFRKNAKCVADTYDLVGFVENLPDGRVEILAKGEENGLRAILDWCYRGSLLANVDSLSFEWQKEDSAKSYNEFKIIREKENIFIDKMHAVVNLGRNIFNRTDTSAEKIPVRLPKHIVIIPDGNRRWAKERGLQVWQGHKEGIERSKELLEAADNIGIHYLTLWCFSTENWSRSADEIEWLMNAFTRVVKEIEKKLIENKISFRHLGRKDRLGENLAKNLADLEEKTKQFKQKTFSLALDYGGRDEIVRAANKANDQGVINEKNMTEAMDTAGLPDPDLIIRTSGEQRLSGMFPWQGTYAELYFSPLHFPDFTAHELEFALADYAKRKRRFGN